MSEEQLCVPNFRLRSYLARSREDEALTNDWWGLHAGDDDSARAKRRPADVDMRKGVELRHCYITTRDGVKVRFRRTLPYRHHFRQVGKSTDS